jgi:FlaA1/EpsC-like NDP-sugar epimerase
MTKALMEKAGQEAGCQIIRYGNVIGSTGSFLPKIPEMLKENKPITLTHGEMTRFWIKQRDVLDYIYTNVTNFKPGLHVPLSRMCVIDLTSLVCDVAKEMGIKSYEVKLQGIRPGEKIHECLFRKGEIVNNGPSEIDLFSSDDLMKATIDQTKDVINDILNRS